MNTFGRYFRITTFGESHGKAIGVVIDGVEPNVELNEADIQHELDRRKPGQSIITTERKEEDRVEILSGILNGKTTGAPICLIILNKSYDSEKYEDIKDLFRPGHADFTYYMKYGVRDWRGSGRASGRETVARVAAGAIAKKILAKHGIKIIAYTKEIGNIKAKTINLDEIEKNPVRCPDSKVAKEMEKLILKVKKEQDSIGGIVEAQLLNVPVGLGEPVFDKLDAEIAKGLMSIGGVKGVEIGAGFKVAKMRGSECNDEFIKRDGKIITKTNYAGGILGGISTGMPIVVRIAVKPTSSISRPQKTIDIRGKQRKIIIKGFHDPCLCPRIVPVVEAMLALVLINALKAQQLIK